MTTKNTEIVIYEGLNNEETLQILVVHDVDDKQYSIFSFIESVRDDENAFFWSYAVDEMEATQEEVIEEAKKLIIDRATPVQIAEMSAATLAQLKANQSMLAA